MVKQEVGGCWPEYPAAELVSLPAYRRVSGRKAIVSDGR
jgi:hypothetical protein